MKTPIADFVRGYAERGASRLHMPGHKGISRLGCEAFDITEIDGADVLGSASGIIAERCDDVVACFEANGFKVVEKLTDNDWCGLAIMKN